MIWYPVGHVSPCLGRSGPFKAFPSGSPQHYNGNEPCDMLVGPCACGAWHCGHEQPGE